MLAGEIYNKRILFAVLNWGLGHATRSSVLIRQLLQQHNQVTLVSAGAALGFLRQQFPQLGYHEMPTREIFYPGHRHLWLKLLQQQKKIFGNIQTEKNVLTQLVSQQTPDLIISDNCYGFFHPEIHSVLLTHQVNIQSPFFEKTAQQKIHRLLQPFHEIWIPDMEGEENLSGKLSRPVLPQKKFTYIGPLSAMTPAINNPSPAFAYCAVISGPEKQRTLFEEKVIDFLLQKKAPAILIRGTTSVFTRQLPAYILVENRCAVQQVYHLIQQSETVIGRTGYTTIMDLYVLQKPCLLLPTPGQTEQEYLFTKHRGATTRLLSQMTANKISPCKG